MCEMKAYGNVMCPSAYIFYLQNQLINLYEISLATEEKIVLEVLG
jgi:hypothetical protein